MGLRNFAANVTSATRRAWLGMLSAALLKSPRMFRQVIGPTSICKKPSVKNNFNFLPHRPHAISPSTGLKSETDWIPGLKRKKTDVTPGRVGTLNEHSIQFVGGTSLSLRAENKWHRHASSLWSIIHRLEALEAYPTVLTSLVSQPSIPGHSLTQRENRQLPVIALCHAPLSKFHPFSCPVCWHDLRSANGLSLSRSQSNQCNRFY